MSVARGTLQGLLGLITVVTMSAMAEAVPGRVADLTWMAGYWTGPFGEETIEEHWMHPAEDTVIGSVRLSKYGVTRMMELIVIEQVEDSLRLRVSQFQSGMTPLHEEPQTMTLKEIGDRYVAFESGGGFVFKTLRYSRPAEKQFVIDAEFATGERLQLDLVPR